MLNHFHNDSMSGAYCTVNVLTLSMCDLLYVASYGVRFSAILALLHHTSQPLKQYLAGEVT